MNYNDINNIKQKIENAYKFKDILKLDKDIKDGKDLIRSNDEVAKSIYIAKIKNDYFLYVSILGEAIKMRKNEYGIYTTRQLESKNEEITQLVRMLKLILNEKLVEELFKVINNQENIFSGGVLNE